MLALTGQNVLYAMAAWEGLHQSCGLLLRALVRVPGFVREGTDEKLTSQGASYAVALIHSVVVTYCGATHLVALSEAPIEAKIIIAADPSDPWHAPASAVSGTGVIFLSYLLYDILHMALQYPALGGLDMICHHLGFIAATCISGPCGSLPFAFSWLILGEGSSIFLNFRWFLIHTGRGASTLLHAVNAAFAISFFVTRIVVYACGGLDLWVHRQTILSTPGVCCTKPLLYCVLGMMCLAYGLNLMWMARIARMARGGAQKKKSS